MLVTTTPNVEGKRIEKYFGVVAGEAILGANIFRDIFAGIRDIVGGRSSARTKGSSSVPASLPSMRWRERREPSAPMRSSASTSTMKSSALVAAC